MFLGSDVLPAKLVATPLGSNCCCLRCQAPLDTLCVLGSGLTKKWHSTDEFWNEAALNGILDHPPVILSFKLMIL